MLEIFFHPSYLVDPSCSLQLEIRSQTKKTSCYVAKSSPFLAVAIFSHKTSWVKSSSNLGTSTSTSSEPRKGWIEISGPLHFGFIYEKIRCWTSSIKQPLGIRITSLESWCFRAQSLRISSTSLQIKPISNLQYSNGSFYSNALKFNDHICISKDL